MKRLVAVISGLLVLPAFAEVAPAYYYDEVVEYVDADAPDIDVVAASDVTTNAPTAPSVAPVTSPRTAPNRTASRAIPSGTQNTAVRGTTARPSTMRATTTRSETDNNAATSAATRARTGVAPVTTSRAAASRAAATRGVRSATTQSVSPRSATPSVGGTAARASIIQNDTVRTPLYTGRVSTRTSSVSARVPTVSAVGTSTAVAPVVAETPAATTTSMDELAQITDFCKAQYTQCMDNFCNVLDDNQGRCSCSANLKNYAKTEAALKQATEDLQDVAQKIQYIGLSTDDITTLFTQTEAELALQQNTDNTQLKNDLDKIKNMIVDVKSGSASVSADTGISMDLSGLLDFSIGSTGFDLASLFGNNQSNTSSISNQRGETLYKTATARCKASVINNCVAQGVDASVITNAYDLEIDKQCIAYERSLTDANDQMASTVRNAKSVLQRARLMVAQQKNAYDLRGCISALDTCMQDDFVCGSDYENCLDPTGKYIVNGDVVAGSTPGLSGDTKNGGLYSVWKEDSTGAWDDTGTLVKFIEDSMAKTTTELEKTNTANIAKYLQNKIGYIDKDGKSHGMCVSVLNKCQDYTYTTGSNKSYTPDNTVVRQFLERALTQIKTQQDEVLANYAEGCSADVYSCLTQNNYSYYGNASYTSNASTGYSEAAKKACQAQIKTCMSATGAYADDITDEKILKWLDTTFGGGSDMTESRCKSYANSNWTSGKCVITRNGKNFTWSSFMKMFSGGTVVQKTECETISGATWDSGTCWLKS